MPGEFEIIERYFRRDIGDDDVVLGIGDDAAVVKVAGDLVVAVDTLVGGVHFPPDLPARSVGHRALAVNLSDFAAMGSQPKWCTLALTIPEADADWLEAFADGFFALASRYEVGLIGGDTTRGPLSVTVQVLGVALGDRFLRRGGGHAGDDVYVTGTLGASAAAIALWAKHDGAAWSGGLFERFAYPEPRVAAGLALGTLASAAVDVSDGLVADLGHVCRQSRCGARIDVGKVPVAEDLVAAVGRDRAIEFALSGGDDYELCFTAPPERSADVASALRESGVAATKIGDLIAGAGVQCCRDGQPVAVPTAGFTHF